MWWAKALHCFSEEFQCRFAVTTLGDIAFKHLALVLHSPPELVRLAVDLHENLVQMPLPIGMDAHLPDTFPADLHGEKRVEPIPHETYRLVTGINPSLVQKVLHIS